MFPSVDHSHQIICQVGGPSVAQIIALRKSQLYQNEIKASLATCKEDVAPT